MPEHDAPITADPVNPEAAMEFWKNRVKLTAKEAKVLTTGARNRAFYVTGLAEMDMVSAVHGAIAEALASGETLADFKKRIGPVIDAQGWKSFRVETIFRTNMQTAYAAGRYAKQQAVKKLLPFLRYVTVEDRHRRPSHAVLHGMVFPADHEFWDSNTPPNGFRCRCDVVALSRKQVERRGLKVETEIPRDLLYVDPENGMEIPVALPGADKGFMNNPGKDWLAGLSPEQIDGSELRDMLRRAICRPPVSFAANDLKDGEDP